MYKCNYNVLNNTWLVEGNSNLFFFFEMDGNNNLSMGICSLPFQVACVAKELDASGEQPALQN